MIQIFAILVLLFIEFRLAHFSTDFSEIVTKVIATTNKSVGKAHKDPMRTHCEKGKLLEARENDGAQAALGLVWYLIGWEGGTNFLDQSQRRDQKQCNPEWLSLNDPNLLSKTKKPEVNR